MVLLASITSAICAAASGADGEAYIRSTIRSCQDTTSRILITSVTSITGITSQSSRPLLGLVTAVAGSGYQPHTVGTGYGSAIPITDAEHGPAGQQKRCVKTDEPIEAKPPATASGFVVHLPKVSHRASRILNRGQSGTSQFVPFWISNMSSSLCLRLSLSAIKYR
jgi:hypothetical protein